MLDREPLTGVTIRVALLLGFGLTLGIWLFAGYYFTTRMADVEHQADVINARYMRAQDLLSTVHAQILVGSVSVRDALLDPNPATANDYRRQFEEVYRSVDGALQGYDPVLDSAAERARVTVLRHEIDSFRNAMLDVLATDSARWQADALTLLRTRVLPKREAVLRLSDTVQALNRSAFVRQQTGLTEIHRLTQRRVWEGLGVALAASLCVGMLATRHASRLEDRIQRQRASEAQYAHDLQRLSAKLISAQEEERRSIARELHDEIGQVLTTLKVEFAIATRAIEASGGPADLLENARSITDGALQSVRDLSHILHPALLDDLGLSDALEWYLRGFGKRQGIQVDLRHEGMEERLARETEAAAYRIVQEALTNVARHARATRCSVSLRRLPSSLVITIEDDGIGFDPGEAERLGRRRGLGLLGIRERAWELRGTLVLESAPGKGTRLKVELPVQAQGVVSDGDALDLASPSLARAHDEVVGG